MNYECWDESGTRVIIEATTPEGAAAEYVAGGDWGDFDSTLFHTIHVALDGEVIYTVTVTVDPPEPACESTPDDDDATGYTHHRGKWTRDVGHEWKETSAQGSGGGVIVTETCCHCGLRRVTDTWATNPSDGTEGHTSVRYEQAGE